MTSDLGASMPAPTSVLRVNRPQPAPGDLEVDPLRAHPRPAGPDRSLPSWPGAGPCHTAQPSPATGRCRHPLSSTQPPTDTAVTRPYGSELPRLPPCPVHSTLQMPPGPSLAALTSTLWGHHLLDKPAGPSHEVFLPTYLPASAEPRGPGYVPPMPSAFTPNSPRAWALARRLLHPRPRLPAHSVLVLGHPPNCPTLPATRSGGPGPG